MKRIVALVLAMLLLAVAAGAQAPYMADNAGLMTRTAANSLEAEFSRYDSEYGFTVAAVTTDSLNGKTAAAFAAEAYQSAGYGNDGVLLLICETEGQWYLYTSGLCAAVISDETAAQIGASLAEAMESGDYYGALQDFADACAEPVCQQVEVREAEAKEEQKMNKLYLVIGMLCGLVMGILVAAVLAGKIKLPKRTAKKPAAPAEPEDIEKTEGEAMEEAVEEAAEETLEKPIEESLEEPIEESLEEPVEESLEEPVEEAAEAPEEETAEEAGYVAFDDFMDERMRKFLDEIMGEPVEETAVSAKVDAFEKPAEVSLEDSLDEIISKIMKEEK